eukprot:Colp12_sorted_trinity150504_noHs@2278
MAGPLTKMEEDVVIDPDQLEEATQEEEDTEMEATTALPKPNFPQLSAQEMSGRIGEKRKIPVPAHRYTPLKECWIKIYKPIVEHMKLDIRMNLKSRCVELRTNERTTDSGALQKAADFVKAFMWGFEVDDAAALLRLDDLYLESFDINDVKTLKGDHLSRAIGRISGKGGKTKFTIENVSKTRIVLADSKVHILGSFQNIKIARNSICNLIMGSPPGKVNGQLRTVASRVAERF